MDCFCHIICPCMCSGKGELENSYDIIPEKGEYYGDTNFKGAKHGHGIFLFAQGDIYEGEWKDDKMHGFGEYRFKDGKILNGYFDGGNFVGNPPPGVKPKPAKGSPQPLTSDSIRSDVQPTIEKHNEASYAFARTIGILTNNIKEKGKSRDMVDNEERRPLVHPQSEVQSRSYQSTQGQSDPYAAARITMEKEKKDRLRRERVERIKQKYNIKK